MGRILTLTSETIANPNRATGNKVKQTKENKMNHMNTGSSQYLNEKIMREMLNGGPADYFLAARSTSAPHILPPPNRCIMLRTSSSSITSS
jgi:hypothetical protein